MQPVQPSNNFGEDPSLDGFMLNTDVMCDDNGLALSLDLQDTMDSLELESFLGDSSLPPTQPDPSMVAHQRRQLKTESKSHVEQLEEQTLYTTSEGVACTNIMNVDFARETQISSQNHMKNVRCSPGNSPQQPQRVATSVSSAGPANVLSAPLQIDGQLIQTTDAKTGQTYWLIVPNSNNQQANVASSPMKHVDNTLQEMQQQTNNIASTASSRPLNKVTPIPRSTTAAPVNGQSQTIAAGEIPPYQTSVHPTVQNNTYSPTAAPYNNNNNNVSTINDAVYQSAPTYPLSEPVVTAFQSPKQFTGSVLRQTLTLPNSDSSTSSDQASPVNDLAQVGQQRNSFPGSESSSGVSTSYENIPSLNTSHVTQYRPEVSNAPALLSYLSSSSTGDIEALINNELSGQHRQHHQQQHYYSSSSEVYASANASSSPLYAHHTPSVSGSLAGWSRTGGAGQGSSASGSLEVCPACGCDTDDGGAVFNIAMRPSNRFCVAHQSQTQNSPLQSFAAIHNNNQSSHNVNLEPTAVAPSRFTVSSFANVEEVETVSYRNNSDSDYSSPPEHQTTITRDSFPRSSAAFIAQRQVPVPEPDDVIGNVNQHMNVHNPLIGKPRSTHNVIEKRYRLSINDKIVKLKDAVLGSEVKMNKSGILQKAIDRIQDLEKENAHLKNHNSALIDEVSELKKQLSASMKQVSVAASNMNVLQNIVTQSQINNSLNCSPFSTPAPGGILVGSVIRPPKVTRPRQESSGASPVSSSGIGSVQSDPFSSDSDSGSPVAKAPKNLLIVKNGSVQRFSAGLTDRAKVTLCMLMMCVVFFNPVGVMVSRSGVFSPSNSDSAEPLNVIKYSDAVGEEHHGNRVLQAEYSSGENSTYSDGMPEDVFSFISQSMVVWLMNAFLVFFIVGKVFIFGEPTLHSKSDEYQTFKKLVADADASLSEKNYASGAATLKRSLALIGCPVPVSNVDLLFSVIWRSLRLLCQRVDFGRCILRKLAGFNYGPKNATMKHAKEVALVYHKLFQLYLTGCVPDNKLCGTLYGLTALTLSDFAYPIMSKVQLVEIVFTCAVGLRFKFSKPAQFLSRGLCFYGRRHAIGVSLPAKLDWLLSVSGNEFFHGIKGDSSDYVFQGYSASESSTQRENKWCIPRSFPSTFTSCASHLRHDPLEGLSQHYRQHLLTGALHATILPLQSGRSEISSRSLALQNTMAVCGFRSNQNPALTRNKSSLPSRSSEPILDSERATLTCRKKERTESLSSSVSISAVKTMNDCTSFWWASIVNAVQAQQWFQCGGDDHVASNQTLGVLVEDMPEQLKKIESSLALAVQTSVIARRILLESKDGASHETIVTMCDRASDLLADAVKESSEPSIYSNDSKLRTLALVFCGDILLATRKELWESMLYLNDQDREQLSKVLEAYKKDLKILKTITNVYHPAKEKCYFYETVCHMMKKAVQNGNMKTAATAASSSTDNSCSQNTQRQQPSPIDPTVEGETNNNSCSPHHVSITTSAYRNNNNGLDYVFWEKMVPVYVKRRLKAARNALRLQTLQTAPDFVK
ncbi:uncharacterized protein LOC142353142 isoform X3 [Convolutriloba macropyga]|uniref:uncharacterized protein LOC142353142 isoform X3 n=1 Tax=Convolutriloba macropyga TaxID=536237 RepID=UPI003F524A25